MKCTACGGALEDGFIPDHPRPSPTIPDMGHAAVWLAVWVAGEPRTGKTLYANHPPTEGMHFSAR